MQELHGSVVGNAPENGCYAPNRTTGRELYGNESRPCSLVRICMLYRQYQGVVVHVVRVVPAGLVLKLWVLSVLAPGVKRHMRHCRTPRMAD